MIGGPLLWSTLDVPDILWEGLDGQEAELWILLPILKGKNEEQNFLFTTLQDQNLPKWNSKAIFILNFMDLWFMDYEERKILIDFYVKLHYENIITKKIIIEFPLEYLFFLKFLA